MTQKLHIKTWGCQMNEYDSSKMADLLLNTHGLELTDIPEEADVLLLNTFRLRASQSAAAVAAGACSDAASSPFMAADSLSKRGRWTFLALQYRQSTFFSR